VHVVLPTVKGPVLWADWSCKRRLRVEWKEEEEEENESDEFWPVVFQVPFCESELARQAAPRHFDSSLNEKLYFACSFSLMTVLL
jgi:hypothetical protein